jgi:hypothetical protein
MKNFDDDVKFEKFKFKPKKKKPKSDKKETWRQRSQEKHKFLDDARPKLKDILR